MRNRIGLGLDHHQFLEARTNEVGKPLTLGGLIIPNLEISARAQSDGDVILHALCNALSTAIGGGSLSVIADPMCKNGIYESKYYVWHFLKEVREAGYEISNISVSVEAKRPKLEKYRTAMAKSMAEICSLEEIQIGIVFTTGEDLSACGQGLGIMAQVIVLLEERQK